MDDDPKLVHRFRDDGFTRDQKDFEELKSLLTMTQWNVLYMCRLKTTYKIETMKTEELALEKTKVNKIINVCHGDIDSDDDDDGIVYLESKY